jgi:hypothetical protein
MPWVAWAVEMALLPELAAVVVFWARGSLPLAPQDASQSLLSSFE